MALNLSPGYICPDFSDCDFPYDFLDIVGDCGLRRMCLQFIRTYDFLICLLSTFLYINARRANGSRRSPQILSGYRTLPVRCPYGVLLRIVTERKAVVR